MLKVRYYAATSAFISSSSGREMPRSLRCSVTVSAYLPISMVNLVVVIIPLLSGAVAQPRERLLCKGEVRRSSPLSSIVVWLIIHIPCMPGKLVIASQVMVQIQQREAFWTPFYVEPAGRFPD
jgi:hypothetical protein